MVAWVGIGAVWTQRTNGSAIAVFASSLAVLLELAVPLIQWTFIHFRLDATGIESRSGIVRIKTLRIAWKEVKSLESSQSWSERLLGIHTVSLRQESELDGSLKIRGATGWFLKTINDRVSVTSPAPDGDAHRSSPQASGEPGPATAGARQRSETPDDTVHRAPPPLSGGEACHGHADPPAVLFCAGTWHLVVSALASGTVVLVAPTAVFAVLDLIDDTPFGDAVVSALLGLPLPLALFLVTAVGLCGGLVIAVLRLHHFRVEEQDGTLEISFGWPGRTSRTVRGEYVTGVAWTANAFEQSIGWARLRLLTPESGQVGTKRISLPSLPVPVLRSALGSASHLLLRNLGDTGSTTDGHRASLTVPSPWPGIFSRLPSLALAIFVGWTLVQSGFLQLWAGAMVGLVVFLALAALMRLLSGRFTYARGLLTHYSMLPVPRVTIQEIQTLHGFSVLRPSLGTSPPALITAASFAGQRLNLRSLRRDLSWLPEAQAALLATATSPGSGSEPGPSERVLNPRR